MITRYRSCVSVVCAAVFAWSTLLTSVAQAAPMPALEQDFQAEAIGTDRDLLAEKLEEWGVEPQQAAARVQQLDDREVQVALTKMDDLPAGAGHGSAGFWAFIGAIFGFLFGWMLGDGHGHGHGHAKHHHHH